MKFIDEVTIRVEAGKGGAGASHFRREKFVPRGGPDGGNGGSGGSIILQGDEGENTLLAYRYRPEWKADPGRPGDSNRKDGRAGDDVILQVPLGTQVFRPSAATGGAPLHDITTHGQQVVLAKGGRGGKGNAFFKSATNQAPQHSQPGEAGDSGSYILSLKLLADVGLIGLPNAGKSTFISRISAAKPKVADYPFTTLEPVLGVAKSPSGRSFVVADVPGLIPGAHQGKGLGTTFLKHIERTRVLAHLLDCSQPSSSQEVLEHFEAIENELSSFAPELSERPRVVILTKHDVVSDDKIYAEVQGALQDKGYQVLITSSATGEGVDRALFAIEALLNRPDAH